MRIKELEHPINEMRQDIIDSWLDSREGYDTAFLIYNIYGPEGIKRAIQSGEINTKKE